MGWENQAHVKDDTKLSHGLWDPAWMYSQNSVGKGKSWTTLSLISVT